MTLTLNEGAWAGAIVLFTLLALAGIASGLARHGRWAPTVLALAGAALIVWVMYVHYGRLAELAGFALLVGAAAWDWRLGRASERKETRHD